jgi:hypothetical protein
VEILIAIIVFAWIISAAFKDKRPKDIKHQPMIYSSRGDYDSHLDFLEMHGFIEEGRREKDQAAFQHAKDHPELYTRISLQELFDRKKPADK